MGVRSANRDSHHPINAHPVDESIVGLQEFTPDIDAHRIAFAC